MKKRRKSKKQTCGLAVLPVAVDGVAVADRGTDRPVVLLSFSAFPFNFFSLLLCSSSCSLFYSFSPSLVLSNVPWSCCLKMKTKLRVISALIGQHLLLSLCYYFHFWFSFSFNSYLHSSSSSSLVFEMTKTMATLVLVSTIFSTYILSFCSFSSPSHTAPHFLSCPVGSPSLSPPSFFFFFFYVRLSSGFL